MQSVLTLLEATLVPVSLDSLEMERVVMVSMCNLYGVWDFQHLISLIDMHVTLGVFSMHALLPITITTT